MKSFIGRIRASLIIGGLAFLVPFGAEFFGIDNDPVSLPAAADDVATDQVEKPATRETVPEMTRKPEVIKTPVPQPSGDPFECGRASYYADSLAGNGTSSGEPYDPLKYTAAHNTLPFCTRIRVVRMDDNRSVNVVVNDRGPFTPGRITDISRVAAEDIGLVIDGTTEVCIYIR